MACGCNKVRNNNGGKGFTWTSEPDPETGKTTTMDKNTEVEVRALVIRKGGTWQAK